MSVPHVVVIGGGFGGLAAVRDLATAAVRVTLVDRRNHHLFQPLLYQVATAALSPSDIAEPLRGILSGQRNAHVLLAEVDAIDVAERTVRADGRTIPYDHLIVAAGVRSTWFGHDDWEALAPGLKTIGDALTIRHRMLSAFERAEWSDDPEERRSLCTFVVIGAGPTGVELAGAIREIATHTLASDFRHVGLEGVRVVLVEAGPDVLPTFPADLRASARRQLETLGVEVRTDTRCEAVMAGQVQLGDELVHTSAVIWAAGVAAAPVGAQLGAPVDRAGRVVVQPDLSIPDHPEVQVIGDLAHAVGATGQPVPGVAPAAIQMGHHAARNVRDDLAGRSRRAFAYRDTGSLATIGRSLAVAKVGPISLSGALAWVLWVFVHLMTLVGHRSKAVVFVKWAWAWLTFDRSSRLLWQDEARRGQR